MYIKSITIDGFKSYAQRTEITGFDQQFNAITGLNGSGKSNILDSICFVLGISNLSHVRATNLQELVYKNGQAGITKATVSITFDNSDPNQSPFGYQLYDEIVITRQVIVGGRNKYMINGTAVSNQKVADLFKSVSLNINNPHFLIMQGRITKVLNMKPPEILSMIEEAAGTSLYESKRENAEKMIEKKQAKLREIDNLIEEETTPKLEKLKRERDAYIEYQRITREIDCLTKIHIAYQYMCLERDKTSHGDELVKMHKSVKTLQERCTAINTRVQELNIEIEELQLQLQGDEADKLVELEKELHDRQRADAVVSSNFETTNKEIKSNAKKQKELEKNLNEDTKTLSKKEEEYERNLSDNSQSITEREQAKLNYQNVQKKFQSESAGLMSNDSGEDATLNDQLLAAKNVISCADTDSKNAKLKLKHSETELRKRQNEAKKTSAEYEKDKSTLENLSSQIKQIEEKQTHTGYTEGTLEDLLTQKQSTNAKYIDVKRQVDQAGDRFPHLQFDYVDPVKNFDRSKVYGPVASLIQVKDSSAATALEVVAGGRLYNIVVEDDQTAKLLLDKGQLKKKYTILPLNKLTAYCIDKKIVDRAKSLVGDDNVTLALDLVKFDEKILPAMKYVFGGTFVCKNSDAAKQVTFDKQILRKCVTLEGDSFDPAGTLTGGSRSQRSGILSRLTEISGFSEELKKQKLQLNQIEQQISQIKQKHQTYSQLDKQLSMKKREYEMLTERLKQTTHGAFLQHIQDLQDTIQQQHQTIEECVTKKEQNTKRVAELEHAIKNFKQIREQRLKQLEQEVSKAKKHMDNLEKKYAQNEQNTETLKLEVEQLKQELETAKHQLEQTKQEIETLKKKSEEYKSAYDETKQAVNEINSQVKSLKQQMSKWNKEISSKVQEQKDLRQEHTDSSLNIKELAHSIESASSTERSAAKQLESLVSKHEWIATEKAYFGEPNTAYDFTKNDAKKTSSQINKLQERKSTLERNINMRAMAMLDKAQSQHDDMLRKRRIILQDKEKLAATILDLNEKKNIAVENAYKQVNRDFASIFSSLLPGATAALSPPAGKTCLDGLEVRVGFGDVWKDSLTELSGGQRSLVALSLILSMLLFKPAPLYILDEVDAALDLSHTQNIGQMLRTHFRTSQFIVVSLKDGMFQNANVLYRTRFIDGVSTVQRFTQNPNKKPGALTDKSNSDPSSSTVTAVSKTQDKRKRAKIN